MLDAEPDIMEIPGLGQFQSQDRTAYGLRYQPVFAIANPLVDAAR